MNLRLEWCNYKAAEYAVMRWHYSKKMPSGKLIKIGVWEDDDFIGVVLFGKGAAPQAGDPFRLKNIEMCELVRVALKEHRVNVSRVIAIALTMLKKINPGLRMVVSYADDGQNHLGIIYQAGNWFYLGRITTKYNYEYILDGNVVHSKTIKTGRRGYATKLIKRGIIKSVGTDKYKYVMPLDRVMRKNLKGMAKPYPKRAPVEGSSVQEEKGGSNPTRTLQRKDDATESPTPNSGPRRLA